MKSNNPHQNYGISQADMYQMYAYSKKYKTSEVWKLYPVIEEMKDVSVNFASYSDQSVEINVKLFFVNVTRIEKSLGKLKQELLINVNDVYLIG
ncbi:5-methylcytosine restriction system specificity protein McrC [Neobacillus niacini]|uniref:5-methylcytosine restriction system specificity protein McrC n=1 Tax=Neobacillus niacini TaxID=86668 RepID=UPI00286C328B|nr:hypothetical protein [Neobacillus niacini]